MERWTVSKEYSNMLFWCLIYLMQKEEDNNLVRRQPVQYQQ